MTALLWHNNTQTYSHQWQEQRRAIMAKPVAEPVTIANLSIVTWNTPTTTPLKKPMGQFEASLKQFGYTPTVLVGNSPWINRQKIKLTVDYLATCPTEYVLGCDSSDVLCLDSLSGLVDRFQTFRCGLVFNAWYNPPFDADNAKWQDGLTKSPAGYLNAGCWIGSTAYALSFWQKVLATSETLTAGADSEQICVLPVYRQEYPQTQIDSNLVIFQCGNRRFKPSEN